MGRNFENESLKDRLKVFAEYFTLGDYDRADKESTERIQKKQSRGSIFAQNGWYITKRTLVEDSRKADVHIRNLRKALKKKA